MTPEEALTYIHSVCWKGSIPGLGRTQELLQKMGNPQNQLQFVHIAGTNGKGSTAAMTASILRKAGYCTGLYTSPYIFRFHERMQVDGQCISDEELAEITEFVKPLAESMEDHPTEFELVTCIAMEYFKRHHCDVVSLEVGMGGELDSTNVIQSPLVAVLTNIGLDHTEFLGDTLRRSVRPSPRSSSPAPSLSPTGRSPRWRRSLTPAVKRWAPNGCLRTSTPSIWSAPLWRDRFSTGVPMRSCTCPCWASISSITPRWF